MTVPRIDAAKTESTTGCFHLRIPPILSRDSLLSYLRTGRGVQVARGVCGSSNLQNKKKDKKMS